MGTPTDKPKRRLRDRLRRRLRGREGVPSDRASKSKMDPSRIEKTKYDDMNPGDGPTGPQF